MLGMLLGNTMNGIALSTDRLTQSLYDNREIIEQRLSLGEHYQNATRDIRKDSLRSGLMPIINAMSTAGLVNLPGMMTGQILGGVAPNEAVKYQILILLLIAASTVIGVILAVSIGTKQLFDERQRLRIDWIIHK
jgi:putative ABC transport system permease protein